MRIVTPADGGSGSRKIQAVERGKQARREAEERGRFQPLPRLRGTTLDPLDTDAIDVQVHSEALIADR